MDIGRGGHRRSHEDHGYKAALRLATSLEILLWCCVSIVFFYRSLRAWLRLGRHKPDVVSSLTESGEQVSTTKLQLGCLKT